MAVNLENYLPALQYNGLNSAKSGTLSGTLTLSGSNTHSGNNTFSGSNSFTGAVSFTSTVAGAKPVVTNVTTALLSPAAAASGVIYTLNKADGITVTLPAPAVGLQYTFYVGTTITSNSYKVITDAGTTFLIGNVLSVDTDSSNALAAFSGNGSTHVALTQAAASTNATGGIAGSWTRFTCVSSTLWYVEGTINAAGSPSTPFATS